MTTKKSNKQRIAKNTVALYFRMLLIMAVSLYTSRVTLKILGIEDFGIYNVVGGVVAILGFLNSSLAGASSRFITFALGKNDVNKVKSIFSSVLCIHFILASFILLLGESIGLWFILNKMVIPAERMVSALWVYQCSILTAIISIISVPYNSLIIAHERMKAFAYISILEALLRLIIVWTLMISPIDKLIFYAVLYLCVQILVRMIYTHYCRFHFKECRVKLTWNKRQMMSLAQYAIWTMNGNVAVIGYTQGINVLLNMFFGPVVNAARGIAVQVQAALLTFANNFQMAVRPQIIKSYANNELLYMHKLVIASSKYGFFLMLVLSFPILICVDPILSLWLDTVPDYTVSFTKIMVLTGIIAPLKTALVNAIHATGDIKKFQIYEGSSLLLVLPIAYFMLKVYHITAEWVLIVYLVIELLTQGIRTWIVLAKIEMSYKMYLNKVLLPVSYLCPFLFVFYFSVDISVDISILELLCYLLVTVLYVLLCITIIGLSNSERRKIQYLIMRKKFL